MRKLIEPGAPAPDALRLERVADAIVSIEYYMETLQSGRNDPWYMLDNAEMCIKTLEDEAPSRVPNIGISSSDAAKTVKLDPAETIALERTKRAHAATTSIDRGARAGTGGPAIPRAVHRGGQGRNRIDSKAASRNGTRIPWIWSLWP